MSVAQRKVSFNGVPQVYTSEVVHPLSAATGAAHRASRDIGDCRTLSYVNRLKTTRSHSTQSSSHVSVSPARIFEHTRGLANDDSLGRHTTTRLPQSWNQIEDWVAETVAETDRASTKTSRSGTGKTSSIKILFLNEKKCQKAWKNEACDFTTLCPFLHITDWTTAHYMTTFCRFPLPLDAKLLDTEPERWDYRYSVSHPFDWDLLWAYFPHARTTIGIMRSWFDDYDADFQDLESIIETFTGPTLAHPVILGLFGLQILTSNSMANVREKGNRLFEAQKLTGFHTYSNLRSTNVGDIAQDEERRNLGDVTREILGAASNLTAWNNAAEQ